VHNIPRVPIELLAIIKLYRISYNIVSIRLSVTNKAASWLSVCLFEFISLSTCHHVVCGLLKCVYIKGAAV